MRILITFVLAMPLFCQSARAEEEPMKIPLDQIWAFDMPGTRPMSTATYRDGSASPEATLLREIRRALAVKPPEGEEAKPAFAVLGTEMDALHEAHTVLVKEKEPRQTFPVGAEVSVVFFSHQFGPYVHLHEVQRRGHVLSIRYRFVPHETEEVTEHIAFVPLGELAVGQYRVEIVRSPMEDRFVDMGFKEVSAEQERRIVSQSFSFEVIESEDE